MPTAKPNTPQAKDDVYNLSTNFLVLDENTLGFKISTASLMSNDLGGNVKKFWGLGDGKATVDATAKGGLLSVSGSDIVYEPNGRFEFLNVGQTAEDTFTYTVQIGNGVFSTATVKILVVGKNDKPVGSADVFDIQANKDLTDNVLTNDADVDVGDTLTASLVSGPTNGTLDLKADGSFSYTPKANYYGNDTFVYRAYDGKEYSEPVTVTLYGGGEPLTVKFGASKGGGVSELTYAPGDYYQHEVDYNSYAEAQGYIDYNWNVDDLTIWNVKHVYESITIRAGTEYSHANNEQAPYEYWLGDDSDGNTLTQIYDSGISQNYLRRDEGFLEFNVSGANGLVSGATLNFEARDNQAYDSSIGSYPDYYPEEVTLDVFVYSGDNAITFEDAGAGTLAGKATVTNMSRTGDLGFQQFAVTLDTDAINSVLSSGGDYLGIRFASDLTDVGTNESSYSLNHEYIGNISVSTASLEFIYV
ncbi:cadherin-like domain-containing protein [Microvirga aerilata]|uniref:Cadherin-like domain-containing protein n=1 Tax=Microvirga aerilata TaxID=670292 RepID=A0A936Z657_9HYPH|nr:Ig-like domain-containing protein [Microvirga aerilata]MBL0403788.1 cadherin-like domain-containing protein [Microvirga aerilata]